MTAPTGADRDKALDIIAENQHGDADPFGEIADAIAAALAEERAKARAPFLALADELDRQAGAHPLFQSEVEDFMRDAADRIRRAAEDAE